MVRSEVSPADLDEALAHCTRCWFQAANGRWKVTGADERGEELYVVTEFKTLEHLLIVTTFRGDEEQR
jgi:hypothetical protein